MDAFTLRLHNLEQLATRYASRRDFAAALQRDESQLSRYLTGGCRIGHQFARHIEQCLALPGGWMDQAHATDGHTLQTALDDFLASAPDPQLADTIATLLALLARRS